MNKIAVITALVGVSSIELYKPLHLNADYYFYSDMVVPETNNFWNFRRLYPASMDIKYENRRCGKIPKMLGHYLLPQYDYYIWHDYTHMLREDPEKLVETYLKDADFGFFNHPHRNCWEQELKVVYSSQLDHKDLLEDQYVVFNKLNVAKNKNFFECTTFIRRNNLIANKVCSLWHESVCKYSSRDQLSLPLALQKYNPKISILPGTCQGYYGNNTLIPQIRGSLRLEGKVS